MNLKQTIKKVLDEQVWALNQTPDTELPSDVKPAKFTPTQTKKGPKEKTKTIERVEIGWTKPDQDIIDLLGCDEAVKYYKNLGFQLEGACPNFKISGWGLPLPKQYIKTPDNTRKYGASRPVGCTSNCKDHEGVDYQAPNGTSVYATKGGKVIDSHMLTQQEIDAGNHCGPGQLIIQSGNYTIIHCHLSKLDVTKGQDVVIGQKIGEVGEGHLHIEIDKGGDRKGFDNWTEIYSKLV